MDTFHADVFGSLVTGLFLESPLTWLLFLVPIALGLLLRPGVGAALAGAAGIKLSAIVVALHLSDMLWWDHQVDFTFRLGYDLAFGALLTLGTSLAARRLYRRLNKQIATRSGLA